MKRGQVTVFIIFAIIIVSLIIIFFIAKPDILNIQEYFIDSEVKQARSFVGDCIESTTQEAIYNIGQTGGYFISSNLSTENNIAYYRIGKEIYIPSKEQIKKELEDYTNQMLFFCTKNFIDFPNLKVEQGEIKTNVEIKAKTVLFKINYPLSISKEERTSTFEKFETEVSVRLNTIYDSIYKIINEYMDEERLCISCIDELLTEKDLYFEMNDLDEETIFFAIIDANSKIKREDFWFYFANKY